MRIFSVILLAFVVVALAGCKEEVADESKLSSQAAAGSVTFRSHCALCHYPHSTAPLHGPGLRGMFKKPSLPSGIPANDDRVRDSINLGRGNMPKFAEILDEQQMQDLLAYLHTL